MSQDFPHEELSRALGRYETSVVAYRQQVEATGKPHDLEHFHTSAVIPALEEFGRLAGAA